MTTINITEQTTTVTTVDEVTTITLANAGVQGASYNQGDPIYVVVRNATGSTLSKGDVVYISGGNGVWTQVTKALATTNLTSTRVIGLIAETIANNASGLCMIEGYLDGVNTQGIAEGTQLYLSATTAGAFTATVPTAPNHQVKIGVCVKTSAGNGRIYIQIDNGSELGELHDVAISSPTNNQVLTYETSSGLWKNKDNTADGVQSVVFSSPLTGGTVTTAGTVGLNQSLLSITRSQVSDFDSGTVANISGTVTQSQVTGLGTALAGKANLAGGNAFTDAQIINANNDATIALQVRRNSATATADIQQWATSTGTAISTISASGQLTAPSIALTGTVAGTIPLAITGASGQSTHFVNIQNSGNATLFRINSTGYAMAPLGFIGGAATMPTGSNNAMYSTGTASVALVVRGIASQSANLQEWQNSGGTALAKVDSAGVVFGAALRTGSSLGLLLERNSGAELTLAKETAATTNPGAGYARLYFRDGTNANTLKLVVRAGAAGAETTILDNIPT